MWLNYRQEYFQRDRENTNSIQTEVLQMMVLKMCGSERGLVEQIYKACENVRCLPSMIIHCIFHKEALHGKIFESKHVFLN